MIAAALADGRMSPEERATIRSRIGSSGFGEAQVRELQQDMVLPLGPEEIAALAADRRGGDVLFRFAALALLADGVCSPAERSWLDRLGEALGIDAGARAAIEEEVAASWRPDGGSES
jgi:uncharacterized membrane protein YebE (DUF533 family)